VPPRGVPWPSARRISNSILTDVFSGLNEGAFYTLITTSSGFRDTIVATSPAASISWPSVQIFGTMMHLNVSGGDTVFVCVHAIDQVDTCGVNVLDTCWTSSLPWEDPWPR